MPVRRFHWAFPKLRPVVRASSPHSRRACPWIEALEDRLVPSLATPEMLPRSEGAHGGQDRFPVANAAPSEEGGPIPTVAPSYTTLPNGVPILDSHPSSPVAIFLDFDGDATTNTTPYSEDADGTTFNTDEQLHIYEAWREMSAYYGFFDVNVTTVQPAAAVPTAWIAIGNSVSGGVSAIGAFPNSQPRSFDSSSDARGRVSAMAHEIGHNFGLSHQSIYDRWGTKLSEYAPPSDDLHGSIMGQDSIGKVHKFFIGHNQTSSGVSTLQDDIAVIANKIKVYQAAGGDGFLADDFGNTIATATPLPVRGTAQWIPAVIERLSDVDAFSFTSSGGVYALSAAPDLPSGVDLKLEVYAADGTRLATSDGANNVQELTMNLPAGSYYALVASHGNYGDVGQYFLSVSSLPAGWASVDVGAGTSGYTIYDGSTGTFSVVGTGFGIPGLADGMQYAYQTLNGDGTIIARVVNIDNTHALARVGVEIRETLATNARLVAVVMTYGSGPQLLVRTTTGGVANIVNGPPGAFTPTWVKLVRAGSTFTGYTSPDGVTWTLLSTATVSMDSSVTVGLLTNASTRSTLNVGTLDNVSIAGDLGTPPATFNSLPAPTGLGVSLGSGTGLNLSWNSVAGATGYALDRSSDGVTYAEIAATASGVTTFSDLDLAGSMRYFYRVSALDATGRSVASAAASAVNRPSAVANFSITATTTSQLVLNWRETTGETGYRIERSTDGITYVTLATLGANVPSYTNSGLTSATPYFYRVTPTSALGDGPSATASGAPRLAAVNPTLGTVAAGSIGIAWTDITNETGYRIDRSTDGTPFTFSPLADVAANVTSFTDSTVLPATEYYYRVFGTTSLTQSLSGTVKLAAAPSASPPAAPWSSQDIGTVSGPGTTDLTSGTFTIISSGTVGGTRDSFRFTSQPLIGDGQIIARIATVENTSNLAKVGLMIRQSSATGSAHAFLFVTPSSTTVQIRSTTDGSTTQVANAGGSATRWVRLVRTGDVFTASYSSNGTTWTTLGSATVTMTGSVLIGLAADSVSTTLLNTSTLDNVQVSNNAPTVATAADASPRPVTGTTTNLSVLGADDHGEANLTYTWATIGTPPAPVSFSANSTNAAKNTTATFSQSGSYTLQVTIRDAAGLTVTSSVEVPVTLPNTLFVTGFTPTASGFTVQLSQPLGADDLNLYAGSTGSLGPVDVTVTGAVTGPVRGSLVVNAAANALTFLRTGTLLPADTYTVVLRSAANGFHTPAGGLLDGNADSTAGDDYTTTFTVAPSSALVVSVPDFVRGPGQPVDVGGRPGLPLRLSDGAGATSVSLTLLYNPALLQITGATALAGATANLDTSLPGRALLTFSSPTPLPAGPLDFVTLTALVPASAPYPAKHLLGISDPTVNGSAARNDDGIHLIVYPGDTSGNAGYSALDATRALQLAVGLGTGFDAYRLVDPVLIADINGDGRVSAIDATRILQEAVGIDQPAIPPLPPELPTILVGGPDPFLNVPADFRAVPGALLTVPVNLDLSDGLEAADLVISYDTRRLDIAAVDAIQRGTLTEGFDVFQANLDREHGTIRVGLGRTAGAIEGRGSGSVLRITFQVRADAPAGAAIINLRQGLGQTRTQLNEGGLDLIPDPSDEEGDALDGRILVLGKKGRESRRIAGRYWSGVEKSPNRPAGPQRLLRSADHLLPADLAFILLGGEGEPGGKRR